MRYNLKLQGAPILEHLAVALNVVPKYKCSGSCGCGEGWQDERCDKLTSLIKDGEHHCIFDYVEPEPKVLIY